MGKSQRKNRRGEKNVVCAVKATVSSEVNYICLDSFPTSFDADVSEMCQRDLRLSPSGLKDED